MIKPKTRPRTTEAATLKPDEAHAILGTKAISGRAFYAAINRNEVPQIRLGRRILIPRVAFMRWLEMAGFGQVKGS